MPMKPAREGDLILILIAGAGWGGYWGKGATYKEALEQARKAAGMSYTEARGAKKTVLSVHPDVDIDPVDGTVISPADHRPIVLARDKQQ